ncbi:MAG: ABC transporter ATP-binding protein [Hyphomicrobiaceae bacterium]
MTSAEPPQPLLETIALSKSFGGLAAVRNVSLTLARGELHAVIGPNGAGKSTLINLLAGTITPSSGRILLGGKDVTRLPEHTRTHLGLARSFQRTNVLASLTVLENVRLAAQAVAVTPRRLLVSLVRDERLLAMTKTALERAGLPYGHDRIAGTLAHGQQRQLEIAMALAAQPKVLLLDEPLAGMGPEEGERVATLLKSLAVEHAVLLIEHDMDFVFAVADRLTVLVEGAVLATGRPDDVRANPDVQAAYLGGHA